MLAITKYVIAYFVIVTLLTLGLCISDAKATPDSKQKKIRDENQGALVSYNPVVKTLRL
ncbi:hypothetical protein AHAT_22940 [Agarivorans sp. Toyoura001]|nr:hypothetical protein AHAT_22940 [Agarivorans sp. Toyoura001]